jgi:ribosomal protein S18 acetylase RimI-like enzyme
LSEISKRYPRTVECSGETVTLELLTELDNDRVRAFSSTLSDNDLLFASKDLREPKVIEAWNQSIKRGDIISISASMNGEIIGTTAVMTEKHSWSSHVGELRIIVSPTARDIGLGRTLIQECFLVGVDLGLEKLTVRLMLDQDKGIAILEDMGFKTEAMLKDHVKDSEGNKHDLMLLSHDVAAVQSMMQAYGVDEAF